MRTLLFLLIALPFLGFAFTFDETDTQSDSKIKYAYAEITSNGTSGVSGYIEFRKIGSGVHVTGNVSGLTPGQHGMHIHETGACDAPSFESAGGHFNPKSHKHGRPDSDNRH